MGFPCFGLSNLPTIMTTNNVINTFNGFNNISTLTSKIDIRSTLSSLMSNYDITTWSYIRSLCFVAALLVQLEMVNTAMKVYYKFGERTKAVPVRGKVSAGNWDERGEKRRGGRGVLGGSERSELLNATNEASVASCLVCDERGELQKASDKTCHILCPSIMQLSSCTIN